MWKGCECPAVPTPNSVAGAIAGIVRQSGSVEVLVVGAGALNQCVKAIASARGFVIASGIDLVLRAQLRQHRDRRRASDRDTPHHRRSPALGAHPDPRRRGLTPLSLTRAMPARPSGASRAAARRRLRSASRWGYAPPLTRHGALARVSQESDASVRPLRGPASDPEEQANQCRVRPTFACPRTALSGHLPERPPTQQTRPGLTVAAASDETAPVL